MTDTPNRPPLWEVMSDACADHPRGVVDLQPAAVAAMIRALRDWQVSEWPEPEPGDPLYEQRYIIWRHNQRLRHLLTAESDRAERGE